MTIRTIFIFFLLMRSLSAYAQTPGFDLQGHRGARGLMPENTVPAFMLALDSGVTTLEMDLAVTKDKQLVVSHEPWMSAAYCLDPSGNEIQEKDEKKYNIFQMTYDEVKQWDCGSKGNSKFPEQKKIKASKPLLVEVIVAAENHIKNFSKYEVDYNIEIKSTPKEDNLFNPKPEEFSDLAYNLIDQYLPWDRVVIQSFDFRVLKYWHKKYPEVRLAALVENLKTVDDNLDDLGFVPDVYSPFYKLLNKSKVNYIHLQNPSRILKPGKRASKMRVIPWTVNDENEMTELKEIGVDGLITDYPNRARKLKLTFAGKR
jgi:glycerophosphoryl diester phosphodiesterase